VLQALGLQQHAHASLSIQALGFEHRRFGDPAAQTRGGGDDVGDGRRIVAHGWQWARPVV
jgi:hypothetical protein